MPESQSGSTSPQDEAPFIRRGRYLEKYSIGPTTYAKWKKLGLIETRDVDGLSFARDRLPEPTK
jgi:hypothetical protein